VARLYDCSVWASSTLLIDIVGYSLAIPDDSFLTRRHETAQESYNYILWPALLQPQVYIANHLRYVRSMLRQDPRMTSATKGTSFGAGTIARVLI